MKNPLEAPSKTWLIEEATHPTSLAASIFSKVTKEEISHASWKSIQSRPDDNSLEHQTKNFSQSIGFILLFGFLLHGPASWLSSSESQKRVLEKIEIAAKPAQNLALQATELQQTKVNLPYDLASGSSVYCNGDPVNGLDPDGRCVEGIGAAASYLGNKYANWWMGEMGRQWDESESLSNNLSQGNYSTALRQYGHWGQPSNFLFWHWGQPSNFLFWGQSSNIWH